MKCHNCNHPTLNDDGQCPECGVYCMKVPLVDSVFIYAKGQLPNPEYLQGIGPGSIICYNAITGVPPPRFVAFKEPQEE